MRCCYHTVRAIKTSWILWLAGYTFTSKVEVSWNTLATSINPCHMIESSTFYAVRWIREVTSVALGISALNASGGICIFKMISSTHILTKLSADIEINIGRCTEPSWYVKYWSLTIRKATWIVQSPRSQYLNSEHSISIVSELPLILKSTIRSDSLECCDSHDKIIHEFVRQRPPSSIHVIIPLIVYNLVSVGALYINCIEDDLAEMYVCD